MKKQVYLLIPILMLLVAGPAIAQTNQDPIRVYEDFDQKYSTVLVDGTFCAEEEISLQVTQDESHERYEWFYVEGNEATSLEGETSATLNLTSGAYAPGYHLFRVLAFTSAGCFEEEEIAVYVLPELTVDSMEGVEYCVNDLPPTDGSEGSIELFAEVDQTSFEDEFELIYQWKKDGNPISGATNSTYIVGSQDDGSEIGTFIYSVDISFAVNDGGCIEEHTIAEITVTPAPEKPVINVTGGHSRGQ
jgi:hypothetical protein